MSKLGALVAGLLALSAMAVAIWVWISIGSVAMGAAGYIALIGGGLATLALGVGLMGLVFYSNRHGFDEAAGAATVRPREETRDHS